MADPSDLGPGQKNSRPDNPQQISELKNSNCKKKTEKTQIATKVKNTNCDKT